MKKICATQCIGHGAKITVDYFLDSPKEYKLFLTLPINLRKNLTLLPQRLKNTEVKTKHGNNPWVIEVQSSYINEHKTIQVKTTTAKLIALANQTYKDSHFYDSIPKPIILPEEQEKEKSQK
jgi:hypothetical protein